MLMNSARFPASSPRSSAAPVTSAAVIVPLMVPPWAGHTCVPGGGGGVVRLLHNQITIGPLLVACSQWRCAIVAFDSGDENVNDHSIAVSSLLIRALKWPLAAVDTGETSSKP